MINATLRILAVIFFTIFFCASCFDETITYAPVSEINATDPVPKNGKHRVREGETVYQIAWRYGLDYEEIARLNHKPSPYSIEAGETLIVKGGEPPFRNPARPIIAKKSPFLADLEELRKIGQAKKWVWPASGRVISSFAKNHKGIEIGGYPGMPVYASAAGKVVYSGNGLRSYGNLIILKHNHLYLSAYAHNTQVFVKEGDVVQQGQKIAQMGNLGAERPLLYFEIRRAGLPIDPMQLLGSSSTPTL
ncbi:MAG: peptidoglycan DD-metalloendopeptidase family protein [Gammaproteobacteria bacterium]|nr:peptidoglycan DD-metalloendopeptidase family protein [Gammaproteobacteria bacterium]